MRIENSVFLGKSNNSYKIFHIITSNGLKVSLTTLGASIQKIALIDENSRFVDVALGFPAPDLYESLCCYAGATLAPNAGRIENARLPIGQKTYSLSQNENNHQLHGGYHNLSNCTWEVLSCDYTKESASIVFRASQQAYVDGYPGNRQYEVHYTIDDTNWITIEYKAYTDETTYFNLSNHTYFNMTGDFSKNALSQELTVFSNNVCINTAEHIPMDVIPVAGTAFDFRNETEIRKRISDMPAEQIETAKGYNHAFLLNKNTAFKRIRGIKRHKLLHKACVLKDSVSGRTMKMFTDAPALVMYSGGFLPEGMELSNGQLSVPSCAIAFEAQDIPNVMHFLPDYYHLTTPEQPFSRTIRFHIL